MSTTARYYLHRIVQYYGVACNVTVHVLLVPVLAPIKAETSMTRRSFGAISFSWSPCQLSMLNLCYHYMYS